MNFEQRFVRFLLVCCALTAPGSTLEIAKGILGGGKDADVLHLFQNGTIQLDNTFRSVYDNFNKSFDHELYARFVRQAKEGLQHYREHAVYSSYAHSSRPHCDRGEPPRSALRASSVSGMAAFPGGVVGKLFGFDFTNMILDLAQGATGPASAGLAAPTALATTGLSMGAGLVQTIIAAVIHIVPPLIPPPVWNNMPLPCVPMVTGHNCFGAVLYPITMADFVIADVTDSMLDGIITGFPNSYASKVGKTSDAMYKACFASYMSMHCSSIFPRCTMPQSRDEPMPAGGRVPMCLHLCILPLVLCPGFWIGDIIGPCSMVSVPPLCTQAFYWNLFRAPPQYTSFDEGNPYPSECPPSDMSEFGIDSDEDPALYDATAAQSSPILAEAENAVVSAASKTKTHLTKNNFARLPMLTHH